MAENEPNVIDVKWVLSEKTGKLTWDSFTVVRNKPKHLVVIDKAGDEVPQELADRYCRILEDQKDRGIV